MKNLIVKNREEVKEPLFIRDNSLRCYEIRRFINNDFFVISIYDPQVNVTNYFKYHILINDDPVLNEDKYKNEPIVKEFFETINKLISIGILEERKDNAIY